jgi:hypothetical protein
MTILLPLLIEVSDVYWMIKLVVLGVQGIEVKAEFTPIEQVTPFNEITLGNVN